MNLLLGATGFIGGHLVEYLFRQGEISKGAFRKGAHLKILDANGVQGIEVDFMDHHTLHEAVEGADTIYNLAAATPFDGSESQPNGPQALFNLLEAAEEMKVKTIVHLSCLEVYGFEAGSITEASAASPSNEYQRAKLEAEEILQEHAKRRGEPRIVIVRAARALGSRDPTLAAPLLRMVQDGRVVVPGSGPMSFAHPIDIASSMYKAATASSANGSTYLVKSFDASMEEVATKVVEAIGSNASVRKESFLTKSGFPSYTKQQLRAALCLAAQPEWAEIGFAPEYGLQRTAEEIAEWQKKDPYASTGS